MGALSKGRATLEIASADIFYRAIVTLAVVTTAQAVATALWLRLREGAGIVLITLSAMVMGFVH